MNTSNFATCSEKHLNYLEKILCDACKDKKYKLNICIKSSCVYFQICLLISMLNIFQSVIVYFIIGFIIIELQPEVNNEHHDRN